MISDDELLLYYYEDGLQDARRIEIANALAIDLETSKRYQTLKLELEGFSIDTVVAPLAARERWHTALDKAAKPEQRRMGYFDWLQRLQPMQAGFAVAAILVLGVFIGVNLSPNSVSPGGTVSITPVSFAQGLRAHMQNTQIQLADLDLNDVMQRQDLIAEIISQNRFYVSAAESKNAIDLARVLRAFEPVLLGLADDQILPSQAAEVRSQLAFELNVMQTKLTSTASKSASML